jgi:transcriptional regulator with XRE-family HTH domain
MLTGALHARQRPVQNADVDLKVLRQRVRILRAQRDMEQRDLARDAGVTPETLRGFERGTRNTKWASVTAIVRALGTTPEVLMQGAAPDTDSDARARDLTDEDYRVAQAFHHSDTERRIQVQRVLSGTIRQADLDLAEQISRLTEAERTVVIASIELGAGRPEPAPKRKTTKTTKEHAG